MKKYSVLIFISCFLLLNCNTQKDTQNSQIDFASEYDPNTVVINHPVLSLSDYLRRLSGVRVVGNGENISVLVRTSSTTLLSGSEPLFLVDGSPFNGSYDLLESAINTSDIKSVSVFKDPSETGVYGIQGVNGVISIKLK